MKCFGFVPRQYSTVHTVQTDMRPLVVLFDLMCIAPGGGIPSTLDTYCRRVKSKKKKHTVAAIGELFKRARPLAATKDRVLLY